MSAACAPRLSPCGKRSPAAAKGGAPATKKGCCKSACCSRKQPNKDFKSQCCSKKPPTRSTSPLSPNHYEVPSKKGISSCCSKPKEDVEYLHFSGDQLDDIFSNPSSKKGTSCCSSGAQTPRKRNSCCISGGPNPHRRSSCCSSRCSSVRRQTPNSPQPPNGQLSSRRGSSCYSSNLSPKPEFPNQGVGSSRQGTCEKPCCRSSTALSKLPSHEQPPSSETGRQRGSDFAPRGNSPRQAISLTSYPNTPSQGRSPSSQTKRKCSVVFSEGICSKPSESLTSSPNSPYNGQPPPRGESSSRSSNQTLKPTDSHTTLLQSPRNGQSPSPPTPRHFHLYRPISLPSEIPTASTWTKSERPLVPPRVSPRDGQPISSRSESSPSHGSLAQMQTDPRPSSSISLERHKSTPKLYQTKSAEASTTVGSPTRRLALEPEKVKLVPKLFSSKSVEASPTVTFPRPALAPDPEKCKSTLKLCPTRSALASPSVAFPTPALAPDPDLKRKTILKLCPSKGEHVSTSVRSPTMTLAPEPYQKSIKICSPSLILNGPCSALSESSTSTSSSNGKSPTRSKSSCFFFARSPKRLRPSPATLIPTPQKSESTSNRTPSPKVSNGSTSSSESPRSCPKHGQVPSRSNDSTLSPGAHPSEFPAMPRSYNGSPSRSQIDPILSPYYCESASLSYSPARRTSRTGLLEVPDLAASSLSDSTTVLPVEGVEPSRPASSWFGKPCHADTMSTPKPEAQRPRLGTARRVWARLWNRSTFLRSGGHLGFRLQHLGSLLAPLATASPKGPANPPYVKDERWIECSDTRAFFIFGVNVVIVIVLTYFVDLLHDGKHKSGAFSATDRNHNSKYCHQHQEYQYRGYPVYNIDVMK